MADVRIFLVSPLSPLEHGSACHPEEEKKLVVVLCCEATKWKKTHDFRKKKRRHPNANTPRGGVLFVRVHRTNPTPPHQTGSSEAANSKSGPLQTQTQTQAARCATLV
jgi:hypothetical protein